MNTQEQAVREAADALRTAIAAATAAGYVVGPHALTDGLDRLSISETAKVNPPAAPTEPEPAPAQEPQPEPVAAEVESEPGDGQLKDDGLVPNNVEQ